MDLFDVCQDWIDIDGFAGAGGASEAMEEAGLVPAEAFNHSPEAIAIHEVNHPRTRHHCEDVYRVDISKVVGKRRIRAGWFSPDCTHHSKAKGGKPLDNKRRGLCWVIVEWIDALGDRAPLRIYLENVEEFEHYGPLGPDGRPDKNRRGELFQAFVQALRLRGYTNIEWKRLRASDYGAGTSRTRLFLVARRDGLPVVWPEATHGKGLLPFVSAADCIDWTLPCRSIFGRERPLADKTLARIAKGLRRFVFDCADPFIVPDAYAPFMIQTGYGERDSQAPRVLDMHKPLGTIVAGGGKHALVAAFLAQHNLGAVGHDARDPLSTIVGTGSQQQLVLAHMLNMKGDGRHRDMREPIFTPCAGGNHIAEVRAFLMKYHGSGTDLQSLNRPLLTIDTEDRFGLVVVQGIEYQVVDIGMRMLHWRELAKAQGFPASYKFDVLFKGKPMTKTAIVRGIGNSVSPPPARALLLANENVPVQWSQRIAA